MNVLTSRNDIAKAMNFNKYPVLKIDIADRTEYGLKGCKVRIDAGKFIDGEPYIIRAEIYVYRDEKKLTTSSWGCVLADKKSYHDFIEDLEYAQAPIIHTDEDVVVALIDSKRRLAYRPFIIRTGANVSRHCTTPISFVDADMSSYLQECNIEL